ncbi:hypothetical protein [Pararhodobacter oceanensis]|uniref:hypothetical protein n=1 Tax=Pararhodobacter oceanensis TaxID=2172121 RepID=UPI003A8E74F7
MRIAIIGLGYVALGDALGLARRHQVVLTGPVPDRVEAINAGDFPLGDPMLADYLARHQLDIRATLDTVQALEGAELVLISAPLAFSADGEDFCTKELESRIEFAFQRCPGVPIVLRSAVPIGFTAQMRARLGASALLYAPEFLRESHALQDTCAPKFLIVGDRGALGAKVAAVLQSAALRGGAEIKLMGASEAEAVKHFSQAYLAARVAFFNELDSYALSFGLNARQVIDGVCLDPRIGTYANNPCFGMGGQRVPRSTQHLNKVFGQVPSQVLPTVTGSNTSRISLLVSKVMERAPRTIGIYNPKGVSGARDPLTLISEGLKAKGAEVREFTGDASADPEALAGFKAACDLVLAQRITPDLHDISAKVFSRDLFA